MRHCRSLPPSQLLDTSCRRLMNKADPSMLKTPDQRECAYKRKGQKAYLAA